MSRVGSHVRQALVAAALAFLVVTSAVPLTAAVAGTGTTGGAALVDGSGVEPTESGRTLTLTHTFERLSDQPGAVRVTVEAETPPSVTGVSVTPPEDAEVVDANGYERTGGGEWTWNRSATDAEPTLTYVVDVDRREDGTLEATSTSDWALFNWRTVDVEWSYSRAADAPEPTVVERGEPAGEGVVGPGYAYLGPYEAETRTVDGETIRLVVPEAAEMAESPDAVADALAGASDDLRVGARNERLTVFVAPAPIDAPGKLSRAQVEGRQDMYVGADRPLDTADNAWFHEYVHSRQSYETGSGMAWFDDASAEYYAAWLAYEGDHVAREAFYEYVRTDEASDAVLRDAESVTDSASYFKGMRVLAALDGEIRDASDRERTLQDVFVAMNAHEGPVDDEAFATLVEEAAGEPRDEWLATYVGTDTTPAVPDSLDDSTTDRPAVSQLRDEVGGASLVGAVLFLSALVVGVGTLLAKRD